MAKKISLINMKGGVGKSTLAVNLAWHFAGYSTWKKKVLVVDLDPQFNASQYIMGHLKYKKMVDDGDPTVYHIFEQYSPEFSGKEIDLSKVIKNAISFQGGGKVDIIPSQLQLSYTLKNPSDKVRNLKEYIDLIEQDYDVIIIDCSPTDSILTEAAYLCSEYVLVPVRPEYLASIGIPLLYQSIQDYRIKYPKNTLNLAGIVFNATENYSPEEDKSRLNVREEADRFNITLFESGISYSRSYPKGARENAPIFRTSYSRYDKTQEFYNFTKELAIKVGV